MTDPDGEVYGRQSEYYAGTIHPRDEYVQWGGSWDERFCLTCGVAYLAADEKEIAKYLESAWRGVEAASVMLDRAPHRSRKSL